MAIKIYIINRIEHLTIQFINYLNIKKFFYSYYHYKSISFIHIITNLNKYIDK
jgi:hypothetical protein